MSVVGEVVAGAVGGVTSSASGAAGALCGAVGCSVAVWRGAVGSTCSRGSCPTGETGRSESKGGLEVGSSIRCCKWATEAVNDVKDGCSVAN